MHLLLDLDNTLVDRESAFARWAAAFVAEQGGGPADLAWLLETDADGYTPRDQLAARIRERLAPEQEVAALRERLLREHLDHVNAVPGVPERLAALRVEGVRLSVVTNGTGSQQRAKLARTGLDALVDAVIVSEEIGAKKPDTAIFTAALATAPADPDTWMIGDHPWADADGGRIAGLRTGWVSRGRPWPHTWQPTLTAPDLPVLLDRLLAHEQREHDDPGKWPH